MATYGIIKGINHEKFKYTGNINSKYSLIFNLSNNKLIGIYTRKSKYYNEGIFFKFIINEFIKNYKYYFNEIDIIINVEKDNINKNIYFLNNNHDREDNIINLLNKLNTEIYINDKKQEYNNYFIPDKEGEYKIKIKFKINLTDYSYMFADCKNITNINFINFNAENITNMEYMFFNCKNLRNINLYCFNIKNGITLDNIFSGCKNLKFSDLSHLIKKNNIDTNETLTKSENLYKVLPSNYINSNCDLRFKVIILGDTGTRKTELTILATKDNIFDDNYTQTLGFDYSSFCLQYKERIIKLEIWDIFGQEIYRSLKSSFYRNASLAIINYSIDNINSFKNIDSWVKEIKTHCSPDTKIFLVGNKINLKENE